MDFNIFFYNLNNRGKFGLPKFVSEKFHIRKVERSEFGSFHKLYPTKNSRIANPFCMESTKGDKNVGRLLISCKIFIVKWYFTKLVLVLAKLRIFSMEFLRFEDKKVTQMGLNHNCFII